MEQAIPVTVTAAEPVAPGVRRLRLASMDGRPMPVFRPGDHVRVGRPGEAAIPLSLAGPPDAAHYELLVADRRVPAGAIGGTPEEGEVLHMSPPVGGMPLVPGADRYLLIGAGLGVAPLLPFLPVLGDVGSSVSLCWVGRRVRSSRLQQELEAAHPGRLRCHDTAGEGRPGLRTLLGRPHAGVRLYCAGPIPFIEALAGAARALGWSPRQFHWDRFLPVRSPWPAGDHAGAGRREMARAVPPS